MSSRYDSSLQTAGNQVPYKLLPGFPTLDITNDQVTAQEKYLIKSSDVLRFIDECNTQPDGFLTFRSLNFARTMPGVMPLMTRHLHFAPEEVGLPGDPFNAESAADPDRGLSDEVYDKTYCKNYIVTVDYIASRQNPSGGGQEPDNPEHATDHTISAGGQAMTISPHKVTVATKNVFAGDKTGQLQQDELGAITAAGVAIIGDSKENNSDILQSIVKIIPTVEHTIHCDPIAGPDWKFLLSSLGCVNSKDLLLYMNTPLYQAEPETLLFTGFNATPKYTFIMIDNLPQWSQQWVLDYRVTQRRILEKEVEEETVFRIEPDGTVTTYITDSSVRDIVYGWNHIWVPKQQAWRMVFQTAANGKFLPIYRSVDFNRLLQNRSLG